MEETVQELSPAVIEDVSKTWDVEEKPKNHKYNFYSTFRKALLTVMYVYESPIAVIDYILLTFLNRLSRS
jgi:hypothetical protein